jgi:exonuclease SbcC
MIKSVELGNFISHAETKLDFEDGVTVFVGHNGAGKSSVIDAITFALFGEHTRKSNKGLIRRGTSQAYAKINFSANGRNYEAVRKIDSKGTLSAQFVEIRDGQQMPLATGERKQFGESMTEQIESRLGLDFTKLKVASIVQQGELNAIIKAKPKEFKELLNAIIGIDKLDLASDALKAVQKNFRHSVQKKIGYDDTHIDILQKELEQKRQETKRAELQEQELQKRKQFQEKELRELERKIKVDSQKESILKQLEERRQELRRYVREAIIGIQKEISEKERKMAECEGCFECARQCTDLESMLQKVESEISEIDKKILGFEKQQTILEEHQILAKKLQLQDGKCPVCDSKVEHLKPIFQVEHIRTEHEKIRQEMNTFAEKRQQTIKAKNEISARLKEAILAQRTLDAHAIRMPEQLQQIKNEISVKKAQIQKVPAMDSSGLLIEAASIDSHAKTLCEKIESLQKEISGFDPAEFSRLKIEFERKRQDSSKIDQEYGAITEKIKQATHRIEKIDSVLFELEHVKDYLVQLGEIQSNIYNRDGPVATSLRSWALTTISEKASEYLEMLNTKIHRITLAEKTRDVVITCYSKNIIIDIDSLSGGEQVSVALALRLGMAHLLGASNLNFVILDEPTTHLDEERRRSLVRVLSQLSDISSNISGPLQLIIITHDSEIFEDSTVEKIYKFEASPDGTKVSLL